MGSIGKAVLGGFLISIIGGTLGIVGAVILATLSDDFEKFMSGLFEDVLYVFGIRDEDIVNVNVHDSLLFSQDDNDVSNMLTQLAIRHAKTDTGIITLLMESSNNIRGSYRNYYGKAESEYSPGLPTTNLRGLAVPITALKTVISNQVGEAITIIKAESKVPTKEEYVYSYLIKEYGYDMNTNTFTYSGFRYKVVSIEYNYTTDNYDIKIERPAKRKTTITSTISQLIETTSTTVTTTTTITVTNKNVTTDNINTKVTKQTKTVGEISGTLSDVIVETSNSNSEAPIGTVVNSTTSSNEVTSGSNYYADNKATLTKVELVLHESTIIESNITINTEIPKGSEVNSTEVTEAIVNNYGLITLTVESHTPSKHYVVYYTTVSKPNNPSYWTYAIGSGLYESLDTATSYITNLEMLPIVSIRHNKESITSNKASNPYKETKEILATVGIDVDTLVEGIEANENISDVESAHIHFGLDPRIIDKDIAKALYMLFDYIYEDSGLRTVNSDSYLVTMTEGSYNASLMWKQFIKTVKTGSIGKIGECTNQVSTLTIETSPGKSEVVDVLLLKKQINNTTYIEYAIGYLTSTTFIKSGGFANTCTGTLKEGSLIIPLSRFFIEQLTPIEQMSLFKKSLRLSIYSINVQHLRYYQTEAFGNFIKIVMYIIAIVIFVFTWWTGGATSAAFLAAVKALLVSFAVGYAFKLLLSAVDSPALKMVLAALYIVAMAYFGGAFDSNASGLLIADTVLNAVTTFADTFNTIITDKMESLSNDWSSMLDTAALMNKELDDAISTEISYLTTEDVIGLATIQNVEPFMNSVDSMIHKAIGINFESVNLTVGSYYKYTFDYESYYKTGVI